MATLEYLRSLAAFPSVSSKSNVDITNWLAAHLTDRKFDVEVISFRDDRNVEKLSLAARIGPESPATHASGIAFFAHSDVVPADEWSGPGGDAFFLQVIEGRAYARGACDMKGPIASALVAMDDAISRPLAAPIFFLCTADEEIGFGGAQAIVRESAIYREIVARRTPGIITEPTQLEVVHGHKGGQAVRVMSHGKAAHSSTSEGVNANRRMIPFLAEAQQFCDTIEADAAWQNSEFTPSTLSFNIGINDRTSAINITPAESVCTIYFRPMPGQDGAAVTDQLLAMADRHGLESRVMFTGEPMYSDPASDFIQHLVRLAGRTASITVPYGTDGGAFHEMEELAVLGPGNIAQAHTSDEWISVEQLEAGRLLYRQLIEHACRSSAGD